MQLFWIGLFGAAGCIGRYLVSGWTYRLVSQGFPWGTLIVNLVGSLLLGLVMEGALRHDLVSPQIRVGITVGFMGGFTTFSTFSLETLRLMEEGSLVQAGANAGLNLVLCVIGAACGVWLARQL